MSNNKYKILLVEDEANIRSFMQTMLEANDYKVLCAATCAEGEIMFASHVPDLVILDLGLPDKDGLEFIRAARQTSTIPIVVLSARLAEADKVQALDMGANDYMSKPFGVAELLARVRAALRSYHHRIDAATPLDSFLLKNLEVRYPSRQVFVAGEEIRLTQTEYNIVALLAQHAGKVLTYSAIIHEIWGNSDNGSIKKLQVNMANIRRKLGVRPGESYIANELGVGYRMCEDEGE